MKFLASKSRRRTTGTIDRSRFRDYLCPVLVHNGVSTVSFDIISDLVKNIDAIDSTRICHIKRKGNVAGYQAEQRIAEI